MIGSMKNLSVRKSSNSKTSIDRIDRRVLQRIVLCLVTLCAIALTMWLVRASDATRLQAREATMTRGWQSMHSSVSVNSAATPQQTMDVVISQWSMRRDNASGQTSLTWTVADSRDVQASLLALDTAQIRTQRIEIKKRESGFLVTVEIAL
jgi:hypothetical protein